jgi:transcriptional regulator
MYLPKHFEQQDLESLTSLLETYPLGALVTQHEGIIEANHIPFLLDGPLAAGGKLIGHVAKGNPVWKSDFTNQETLVIFQGPESYITPNWYPSKQVHHQVVPTYNYAVVHIYGRLSVTHDEATKRRVVEDLTASMEKMRKSTWQVSDAPSEYIEKMLNAIVGIELTITRIQAKWKVSQNRDAADREGVALGLSEQDSAERDERMSTIVRVGKGIGLGE